MTRQVLFTGLNAALACYAGYFLEFNSRRDFQQKWLLVAKRMAANAELAEMREALNAKQLDGEELKILNSVMGGTKSSRWRGGDEGGLLG